MDRPHGNVIVVSHRRSGTHLAIDAIRNNFPALGGPHVDLDHLRPSHAAGLTPARVELRLARGPAVLKSHAIADTGRFFGDAPVSQFVRALLEDSRVVYVHRDGRDVMVSLYHYAARFDARARRAAFGEFLRMPNEFDREAYDDELSRVEFWCRHVEDWLGRRDVLHVGFDDLLSRFEPTVMRIGEFLGLEPARVLRRVQRRAAFGGRALARRIAALRTRLGRKYSSVGFRKGVSGDHLQHFSAEDRRYFDAAAAATMRRLGYYGS